MRARVRLAAAGHLGLLVPLLALERRMRRTGGPGIIAFELAATPEQARAITSTWGENGRAAARLSLLLDFPYLVTYGVLQKAAAAGASRALRGRGRRRLAALGPAVERAQVLAAAFDAVENASLLGVLAGHDERLSRLACRCAQAKFALLTVGWAYAGVGFAAGSRSRP